MQTGQVTATSLNVRTSPNGGVIAMIPRGTNVDLLEAPSDGWLHVSSDGIIPALSGWVSSQYVVWTAAVGLTPMSDSPAHPVTIQGSEAIGPNGSPFARKVSNGFATSGQTALDSWLSQMQPTDAPSSSVIRVVKAVSANEGRLEAVNSYDNAHMSFGMLQWTIGANDEAGELAGVLAALKAADPGAFQDCLGQYGLDTGPVTAFAASGNLYLNGVELALSAAKDQFRSPEWAYRFWRTGNFDVGRSVQLKSAAARIGRFANIPVRGFSINQWFTSEFGVALVLDEHVNRPGHVPTTVDAAVTACLAQGASADPTAWAGDEEAKLIVCYEDARANTTMTDPTGRSTHIADAVHRGQLSDQPGSFTL